jgi:GTPase SAR1 family protein
MRYTELREQTLALFPALLRAAETHRARESKIRLATAQGQLRDATLRVVVCGEFKRGKSTLLNALLGVNLLPDGKQPTTSVVTEVGYGSEQRVLLQVTDRRGELSERPIKPAQMRAYVTERGNPHNEEDVCKVRVEIPNPELRPGLVLVDTPGVSSVHPQHTQLTIATTRTADAVLFVTDTTEPVLTDQEKDLLLELQANQRLDLNLAGTNALILIVNKIDRVREGRAEYVSGRRDEFAAVLGVPPAQVRAVGVSSRDRLRYLTGGRLRDHSNFAELDSVLWATLARRQAGMLLRGALADLQLSAEGLAQPLRDAISATDMPAGAESLRVIVKRRVAELGQQTTDDAQWRAALDEGMRTAQKSTTDATITESGELFARLLDEIGELLNQPDQINMIIADNVTRIVSSADARLSAACARLQHGLAARYGLIAEPASFDRLPLPPVPEVRLQPAMKDAPLVDLRRIKFIGLAVSTVTTAALKLTLPLMNVIGIEEFLGAATGGIAAQGAAGAFMISPRLRFQLAQPNVRHDRVKDAKNQITRIAAEMNSSIRTVVATGAQSRAELMRTELLSRVTQERDSALRSLQYLDGDGTLDLPDAAALRPELEAQLAPLTWVIEQIGRLAQAAELAASSDSAADADKDV